MSTASAERTVDKDAIRDLAQRMETLRLDMDRLGAHFIHHIDTPEDYQQALTCRKSATKVWSRESSVGKGG